MSLIKIPINKILIVRRDNIGDLVCTTPAISALRKHYPNAEIAALVNSYNAEALLSNPNLDRVLVYQKLKHSGGLVGRLKAIGERLRLIAWLRNWKPDVTILAKASYDRHGLNFARQINAKNIIGYVPADQNQVQVLPDIQIPAPEFKALHEVEAVNGLLQPLGVTDALGPLKVFPDGNVVARLKKNLPEAPNRIALHISAREPERRWGLDNFIALTLYIFETYPDSQILLFWSPGNADDPRHPGDDAAGAMIVNSAQNDRLIPMPTRSLTELIAALSLCDLFIGADGGAMHLAVALNMKIVGLYENRLTKLNHWYPWQVFNKVVHSTDVQKPDVKEISQHQVKAAMELLLQQSGNPRIPNTANET